MNESSSSSKYAVFLVLIFSGNLELLMLYLSQFYFAQKCLSTCIHLDIDLYLYSCTVLTIGIKACLYSCELHVLCVFQFEFWDHTIIRIQFQYISFKFECTHIDINLNVMIQIISMNSSIYIKIFASTSCYKYVYHMFCDFDTVGNLFELNPSEKKSH